MNGKLSFDLKGSLMMAQNIALAGMKSGQEIGKREATIRAKQLLDALDDIALLYELNEDRAAFENVHLLYDARCIAREAIAAYEAWHAKQQEQKT